MNQQPVYHLNYDELLQAVVDPDDLTLDRRGHLDQCPQCMRAVQRLEQRYTHLGRMARKMAPEPSQAFRAPRSSRPASRWQFKPALALGLAGALILILTVWWPQRFDTTQPDPQMFAAASDQEQELELMRQVDAMVEDALPSALQQLASVTDSNTSQDLIEWVLPSIDEQEALDPHASSETKTVKSKMGLLIGRYLHFSKRGFLCSIV